MVVKPFLHSVSYLTLASLHRCKQRVVWGAVDQANLALSVAQQPSRHLIVPLLTRDAQQAVVVAVVVQPLMHVRIEQLLRGVKDKNIVTNLGSPRAVHTNHYAITATTMQ